MNRSLAARLCLIILCIVLISAVGLYSHHAVAQSPDHKPLLPHHRIVGYYGNFHSARMGVLGEYPKEEMLSMLKKEVKKWEEADPETPVIPAIELVTVVAQNNPGADDKFRLRMSDSEIQHAIDLANEVNGLAILDVQVGFSSVEAEIPRLEQYLKLPNVMLALDPEFDMYDDNQPGSVIGTMDAKEINYAINYLADIVKKNDLPPKILIVHRFTQHMVTNYREIKPVPDVQVVMDMDGWGPKALKLDSYEAYVAKQPVEFTGFKLFYKNDLKEPSTGLYTPEQILKFKPAPVFILYQ